MLYNLSVFLSSGAWLFFFSSIFDFLTCSRYWQLLLFMVIICVKKSLKRSLTFGIVREFGRLFYFESFEYWKVFDLDDSVLIFDVDLVNYMSIEAY